MAQDSYQDNLERFKQANQNYIDKIQHDGLTAIYDAMLDTLFVEIGEPREALTEHLGDNVMVRIDPETLEVVGLEILDFLDDFVPANRLIRDAISSWGLSRDIDSTRTLMTPQYAPIRDAVTALIGQFTQVAAH
jgi:uncharacterized protein YuzE